MEISEAKTGSGGVQQEKDLTQCVRVAVNVRPLITTELLIGCTDCITVTPGEPQVQIGSHMFTFDHVFGITGSPSSSIFDDCVAPLVDALFHGYNATVLAYGQTGSGKTYTMGTNYGGESNNSGIIPKVMEKIFTKVEAMKDDTEFLIRVSFIEIFKEEVFDLLDSNQSTSLRSEGGFLSKPSMPSKVPIQIRETVNGGITLAGVTEAEVRSKEEMASFLARGSLSRATGSTNMNSQSSRSHAIFTISMEQKKNTSCNGVAVVMDELGDDILCAKLHLVDLAGSERAKRTGADGLRLKEGIHINRGLLALGNVISALGDEKKRKEGGHVPYRDSKLTRLLQDSLGGNSKTVMIACVSPADTNAEETLNTLKYANRARNIQNKAIINRDPMPAQMQRMRSQIEQLQAELLYVRGEGAPFEELQLLRHKISVLEASNAELRQELHECQNTCERLAQHAVDAQVEKDKLLMKIESNRNGKSWDEIDNSEGNQDFDLVKNYMLKIQELEGELQRMKNLSVSRHNGLSDSLDIEDDGVQSKAAYMPTLHDFPSVCDVEVEDVEKELEHSSLQDKLDRELQELDKRLEQKEAEMKRFSSVDTSVLKQHYEKKLLDLEQEKKALQKEIELLQSNLSNISSASDDGAQKLKDDYLQKLNALEAQVSELKRKQQEQSQLLRQKHKSEEAARRLQDEIQRIKTQKVQLQHSIKKESEQFRLWKASREKEVLQLKKEGRRNEYEMHKLLALNQRQKMVLQRKTEEASMATKRLKELLEARKASSRETSGIGNGKGPGIQVLMQAIEHELEVMVRVHEVRSEYERQKEARFAMATEVAKLKEESEKLKQKSMSDCPQTMSPGARNSRIFALENMLATSSSTLVSMASQLSEAEERERIFSGRGRWNQVRTLAEAKNLMNHLFNLASSSRCQLRDNELGCREKDSVIKELKDKVVRLSTLVRQKAERHQREMLLNVEQRLTAKNSVPENDEIPGGQISSIGDDSRAYDLRKGPRGSQIFSCGGLNMDLLEDMDTSDSDQSEKGDDSDVEWVESIKQQTKKRVSKTGARKMATSSTPEETGNTESYNSEISAEVLCCSCSKRSTCKTNQCECRATGAQCGPSCRCAPSKCVNRENGIVMKEPVDSSQPLITDDGGSCTLLDAAGPDNTQKSRLLASHGAMLLQSALSEKLSEVNEGDVPKRIPLTNIGNTINSNMPKQQNPRKKWRKSVQIQLIPTEPPAPNPENNKALRPTNDVAEPNIPLELPRAMMVAAQNINPLRERNSKPEGESKCDKEVSNVPPPKSPVRWARDSDEKESNNI
ncbi:P-loop containing nucleoside triphosphate hydrolases superfamily protein [Tasmannia lanceolata]|uniref:P-loop containing nucleoside triphosphate hydrolases superfamily protein n=1 Tax=Tasmannia lanceolata TaxID=3420 RepID=UPI004064250D